MQFINDVKQKALVLLEENSTTLLTAGGVVGAIGSTVLAGRAGYIAGQRANHDHKDEVEDVKYATSDDMSTLEKTIKVAPLFAPPGVICAATVTSIIMAHRMSSAKVAAIAAAYGLLDNQFGEYKDKVTEKLTGPKATAIDDELAQDRVNKTDGHQNVIIIEGEVLCFESYTGRYFNSTMEKIRRAANSTLQEIHNHGFATASYFYEEIDLPDTSWSEHLGWNLDTLFDLKYSSVISKDGRPCITVNFVNPPIEDYHPKHF